MTTKIERPPFLDIDRILSYNKLVNFIVALRGYGKTYGCKKYAINRFLKHGEEFIYIKRHREDLKGDELNTFFDTISEVYPDEEFQVKGKLFYCNKKIIGRAIPLTRWQKIKSSEFPNVTTIIFDEFIKEKDLSYYLPNEVEAFLNVVDTVFRNRDNFRIFLLGNAVTLANPYFVYFKIFPKKDQEILRQGEILVNIPKAEPFIKFREQTAVGRITKNTNYANMALYNQWKDDDEAFLEKRTERSKQQCVFELDGQVLGLWYDVNLNLLFLSKKKTLNTKHYIVFKKEDFKEGRTLVTRFKENYFTLKFGKGFLKQQVRFEDVFVRDIGYEILKQLKVQ